MPLSRQRAECKPVPCRSLVFSPGQRLAFGGERFERLVAVKRRYNPANRFRFNPNIPPGSVAGG
jgi:hypothetical protein